MNETLTTAQRQELKTRLLAVRKDLQDQMQQNRENLAPPAADQDGIVQGNVGREVDQALTNIDAADLARIDHALEALEDGSYGLCGECAAAAFRSSASRSSRRRSTAWPASHAGNSPRATPGRALDPTAQRTGVKRCATA